MWAHNPQFHRTETWIFYTFLFTRLFPLINLVCTSRVPYLVVFSTISAPVLKPDALAPLSLSGIVVKWLSIRLKISHTSVNFSRCIPLNLNSRDTSYPIPLVSFGWSTSYRSEPLKCFLLPHPYVRWRPRWKDDNLSRCTDIEKWRPQREGLTTSRRTTSTRRIVKIRNQNSTLYTTFNSRDENSL